MSEAASLESERLRLLPMSMEFANNVYLGWLNDAEVNRYLEVPKQTSLEELRRYVQNMVSAKVLFWAIVKKSDGKHIGNIKIDPVNTRHGYAEYGILMGDKTEWGKGYAKEASQTIIDFCFRELGLRKINLGVLSENQSAVRLYQSLNFVTEGVYRNHVVFGSGYCDVLRMALFNKVINYS